MRITPSRLCKKCWDQQDYKRKKKSKNEVMEKEVRSLKKQNDDGLMKVKDDGGYDIATSPEMKEKPRISKEDMITTKKRNGQTQQFNNRPDQISFINF